MLETKQKEKILEVSLDKICVNLNQPRKEFIEEELQSLANSILTVGLIQPPVVKPLLNGKFEIIAGERRYRACCLLKKESIPVIVRESGQEHIMQMALIENIQRVDLNPIELALAFKDLMLRCQWNQDLLAIKVGKKRSTVANYLRLLGLPDSLKKGLEEKKISMGHAKLLLSLQKELQQQQVYRKIIDKKLTVRDTEREVHKILKEERGEEKSAKKNTVDLHLQCLLEKLEKKLGTKVSVQGGVKKGCLQLHYYSFGDLERLLEELGIEYED